MADIATAPTPAPAAKPSPAPSSATPARQGAIERLLAASDGDDSTPATKPAPDASRTPPAPKPDADKAKPAATATKPADKSASAGKPIDLVAKPELTKYEKLEDIPTDDWAKTQPAGKVSKALKLARELAAHYKSQSETQGDIEQHPQFKKQVAEAAALKSNFEKAQAALRLKDYSQTEDYQKNFYKPYEEAWATGQTKIQSLKVMERTDPNTDQVIQPARQATDKDFDRLMGIENDGEAAEYAEKLFGSVQANVALKYRDRVLEKAEAKTQALDRMTKEGAASMAALQEASAKNMAEAKKEYQREISEAEKSRSYLNPVEGDDDGNTLLSEADEFVNSIFGGVFKDEAGNVVQHPTPKQKAIRHAKVRNMAKAFPRTWSQLKSARATIVSLNKKLEQYEASQPGLGGAGNGHQPPPADTMTGAKARLAALAR